MLFILYLLLKKNYFLQPQIEETLINYNNITYKLTDCIPTDGGPSCNGLLRIIKPYLLSHSINVCILTVYPVTNFSILYKVKPQHVCFASTNTLELHTMGLSSPVSGCLQHLELLHWNDNVFYLTPDLKDDKTLTWIPHRLQPPTAYLHLNLATVLQQSNLLSQHLANNQKSLDEHQMATTIVANQLKDLSHIITQDSNHNWYDFLFHSPTAHRYFTAIFTPIIIITIILMLLCVCNCWMYQRIQKLYTTSSACYMYGGYLYAPKQP